MLMVLMVVVENVDGWIYSRVDAMGFMVSIVEMQNADGWILWYLVWNMIALTMILRRSRSSIILG